MSPDIGDFPVLDSSSPASKAWRARPKGTMADKQKAEELKAKGNQAVKENKFEEALQHYSDGIAVDPNNHVLYSNRSAVLARLSRYEEALSDAERTVELKPDWAKGYSRLGYPLLQLGRCEEAKEKYQEGLKLEPDNQQLKEGLAEAEDMLTGPQNPFNIPGAMEKLQQDPRTADLMKDPAFVSDLRSMQTSLSTEMLQNSKILTALSVLLGVDLQAASADDPLVQKQPQDAEAEAKEVPKSNPEPASQPAEDPMSSEPSEKAKKKEALAEKELGNTAYKSKQFEAALQHYDRALELDPSNVALYTNKAAVYFEQQAWDRCLELCDQAVEAGREHHADYKLIARALARKGSVYLRQEQWQDAIKWFDKSLAEHWDQEVVKKKQKVEKVLAEIERQGYIDPDKSLEEKEKGNDFFKRGQYPEAVKCYTEAIRRNPEDARLYSNRAACYTKLAEFRLGLQDCEECLRREPSFVKAYLRKGQLHLAMKDTFRASEAYSKALELDPNCSEAKEGLQKCMMNDDPETRRKIAMQDPEIQEILADPAMQMILQQMQKDPAAARDHLSNPAIAEKFQKLLNSGIASFR